MPPTAPPLLGPLESRRLLSLTTPDPTFAGGKGVSLLNADGSANDHFVVLPNHQIITLGGYSASRHRASYGFRYVVYDSTGRELYSRKVKVHSDRREQGTQVNKASAVTAALAPDGKVVLGGYLFPSYYDRVILNAVVRLNRDGSADPTFGQKSYVFVEPSDFGVVAVQLDGKVIVAHAHSNDFGLNRYASDGSPDLSFGPGGAANGNFLEANINNTVSSLLVQPDGKILVGGQVGDLIVRKDKEYDDFKEYFALACYNADGTLDTSFGTGGYVVSDVGGDGYIASLHAGRRGRFYAVGTTDAPGVAGTVIVRYRSSGRIDRTFGTDGKIYVGEGNPQYPAPSAQATLDDDGKLYEVVHFRLIRLMGLATPATRATRSLAAPPTPFGNTPIAADHADDWLRDSTADFA